MSKELQMVQKRTESLISQSESLKKEVANLEKAKEEAEKLKELTINGINQLEKDINSEKREAFDDRSHIEDMRRGRDILQKELDRAENNNKRLEEELLTKSKY